MKIIQEISEFKGSKIIGLDTIVNVKLSGGKKNPMQNRVKKMTEGNIVMIFTSAQGYKNMVNRRLRKQFEEIGLTADQILEGIESPDFEPGKRAWGTRLESSPIIEHNGKLYLECIFIKAGKSKYFLDGEEIDKESIIGLEDKKEGTQGGLIDKVVVRTYALESIIKIRKSKKEILGYAMIRS
jgi:hypothetical protein